MSYSTALRYRRHILYLAAITLNPLVICSQDARFRIEHVATRDGPSHGIVHCILQDRYGFMWLGTREGLEKYDGYEFRSYRNDPDDSTTLGDQPVNAIAEDSLGHIWVGSNVGMLSRMDRRTERCEQLSKPGRNWLGYDRYGITWLGTDRRGTVWIGGRTMLTSYDAQRHCFTRCRLHVLPVGQIMPFIDPGGDLWVCVSARPIDSIRNPEPPYLGRYDPASGTFTTWLIPAPPGALRILGRRADGRLNIVFERIDSKLGALLYVFDPVSTTFQTLDVARRPELRAGDQIDPRLVDAEGQLWYVITSSGLGYDPLPRVFCQSPVRVAATNSLGEHAPVDIGPPSPLFSMNGSGPFLIDRAGTIWIGTEAGVTRVSRVGSGFVTWHHDPNDPHSITAGRIRSLCVDAQGTLWAGTDGGLNRFDSVLRQWRRYAAEPMRPGGLPNHTVNTMTVDRDGLLLLGNYAGPVAYDSRRDRFELIPNSYDWLSGDTLKSATWAILRDYRKQLWVGSRTTGVRVFDSNGRLVQFFQHNESDTTSIADGIIFCMHQDRQGTIWIGTGTGLCRWLPESKVFRVYRHQPGNPHSIAGERISAIHEDSVGKLWICIYGAGLCRYNLDRDDFTTFTIRDGLKSNNIFGMLEESADVFWLSTDIGLVRWNRRNGTLRLYNVRDGLQGNEFGFEAFLKGPDGTMYFGGSDGLSAFKPSALRQNQFIPPIRITAFRVFDSLVAPELLTGETVRLRHDENFFSFQFAALDYINPGKNEYRYKLEGVDPDWVSTDAEHRVASYTDLTPGTYVFRVCGTNSDGLWNSNGTFVTVIVEPPWWGTFWFKACSAICGVALVAAVMGMRIRGIRRHEREKLETAVQAALEMQEEERGRIARDLHDGVGQKMSAAALNLGGLRETLRLSNTVSPQRVAQALERTIGILSGASGDLRAVSHALGTTTLDDLGLPAAIMELVVGLGDDCPTRFEFVVVGLESRLPRALELGMFRVAQELIANVLKHARAREATVQLLRDGAELRLTVEDDGVGFDPSTAKRGMGLRNITERVAVMDGAVEVDSQVGHGTTVLVVVPAG